MDCKFEIGDRVNVTIRKNGYYKGQYTGKVVLINERSGRFTVEADKSSTRRSYPFKTTAVSKHQGCH